jgi:hypothetical protein
MTSGAAAAMQRKTTAIVNVVRLIAPVHIILPLPCREQKGQNPPRQILANGTRSGVQPMRDAIGGGVYVDEALA